MIDLHISDMKEVGKAPGSSKEAALTMLKRRPGSLNMVEIDRERIVKFGRARAKEHAGPVTLSMDVKVIKLESSMLVRSKVCRSMSSRSTLAALP